MFATATRRTNNINPRHEEEREDKSHTKGSQGRKSTKYQKEG
jgi:hypothetical protein